MGVTTNIVATYRGPGKVMRRLLSMGAREDRALAYLMGGCMLVFVAQMPRLAREAHLTGEDLNMLMGGTLLAWIFIAPLAFYIIAGIVRLIGRVFGGKGSGYGARLALFWALLASSPLMLFYGLTAGMIGPSPALTLVGVIWCAVFFWFWIAGSIAQERAS
ncbi:MAG: YIP1 family protein [Rhodobacteraceae bacterium]|nr:YIP1 family protein [Paracoccaceae bacterium]